MSGSLQQASKPSKLVGRYRICPLFAWGEIVYMEVSKLLPTLLTGVTIFLVFAPATIQIFFSMFKSSFPQVSVEFLLTASRLSDCGTWEGGSSDFEFEEIALLLEVVEDNDELDEIVELLVV